MITLKLYLYKYIETLVYVFKLYGKLLFFI